ncbi:MAG TPA: hypothetical protein VMV59_07045 [Candidatus Dormibacteraeota bacterium]|nr:hypothetical protein [Candidatus Dormibacteraeota bacterium]
MNDHRIESARAAVKAAAAEARRTFRMDADSPADWNAYAAWRRAVRELAEAEGRDHG